MDPMWRSATILSNKKDEFGYCRFTWHRTRTKLYSIGITLKNIFNQTQSTMPLSANDIVIFTDDELDEYLEFNARLEFLGFQKLIAAFREIIYRQFATSFAYTISQGRFGLNTKLCQSHICRINFSFSVIVGHVSGLVVPIVNCKSSCFTGISTCSNVGLDLYPSFSHLAQVVVVNKNMRLQSWLTLYPYSPAIIFIYL